MIKSITTIMLSCYLLFACQAEKEEDIRIKTDGPEKVSFKVLPFDMARAKLLDGPFKHATELNITSLLQYEPNRLLAWFRESAGLEPRAEHYDGWEGESLAGHSLGHYLSACALMYKTTQDERFQERVNYMVDELAEVQQAQGDGYLGAFPGAKKIFEEEVAKGDIRSHGFDLNGLWSPFYTQHKILAGLRDAYQLCGNEKALKVATGFADWIGTIVDDLTEEQIQEMLNCEYGGMNEVLADLYAETGDEKYMTLANVFYHKEILDPLAAGEDVLPGTHANTQIPKLIGLAREYELTGNEHERKAATFFWNTVVDHHSYVTGGNANHEYFGPPDTLRNRLSDETTETCNVYNMLKLSRHLFAWEASAKVADYYERALLNQILSSQHPENGQVIYNLSLEMGGHKHYQNPMGFTCCVGTGMENHSKYAANIYFHNDEELYISQFIASELQWEEKGLTLTQKTQYPEEQGTTLEIQTKQPTELTLMLRHPYWLAEESLQVSVNGEAVDISSKPGSFFPIKRTWKTGDKISIKMPFTLRLEGMPDDGDRIAVMYGPLVMAGDLGPQDDPQANDSDYVPRLMAENRDPNAWIKLVPDASNTFKTLEAGEPRDFTLKPFYTFTDRRYSVYFDLFNQEKWRQFQAAYEEEQARKKKLELLTHDFFQPGEMQPERNHNFQSEKTYVVEQKGKKARQAERGGQFSFDMQVLADEPMQLVVEYWGGYTGSKTFDIVVEDSVIATQNISGIKDGYFLDIHYDLPKSLTRNKTSVHVEFLPHEGHRAGPIFGVRTIRYEQL
uniref:Glycoside hydrolase family 127 protein n=1 Tax=Roseihalotalea indica TaxID=2867963 RepID=A0AA49GNB6_9BACT|nr:glycoside hydrolase family 127 protein [Tunicatimonas sp. TK19036]